MADETENSPSATAKPRHRRRAPTIELKATEIAVEPPAGADAPPAEPEGAVPPEYSTEPPAYETGGTVPPHEPPPPPQRSPAGAASLWPLAGSAAAGGLAALLVVLALWATGLFSGPQSNSSDPRLAAMEARMREMASRPASSNPDARAIEELTQRLGRLENAPRTAASDSAAASQEEIKALQAAIADLTRRLDDNATATREARGRADASLVAADAARVAAERTNVEALGNRIAALERASKTLADDVAKSLAAAGDRPLRAAVAAQALRASVERGDPFAAELAAAKTLAADPQMLAPLEPFAANGLPSAAALARQLSDIAPTMLKTSAPPAEGGFLDRLQANAERLVRVRPIEETPGDDPAAVISRAQARAARSDFSGAVTELNALPPNVRAPAQEWIKKAEARNAAVNASRRFVADALAALGKPSP